MDYQEQIGFALRRTGNEIRRYLDYNLSKTGISGLRGAVLGMLCHGEVTYQRDIEKKFNIRRAAATTLLQGMEEQGLICRETTSHDARLKRIVVTEYGMEIENKLRTRIEEMENIMRKGFSQEEIEQLFEMLGRIRENLGGEGIPSSADKEE